MFVRLAGCCCLFMSSPPTITILLKIIILAPAFSFACFFFLFYFYFLLAFIFRIQYAVLQAYCKSMHCCLFYLFLILTTTTTTITTQNFLHQILVITSWRLNCFYCFYLSISHPLSLVTFYDLFCFVFFLYCDYQPYLFTKLCV